MFFLGCVIHLCARWGNVQPRKIFFCRACRYTEPEINVCTWLGDLYYCSCLTVLPGPALVLHIAMFFKLLFRALYVSTFQVPVFPDCPNCKFVDCFPMLVENDCPQGTQLVENLSAGGCCPACVRHILTESKKYRVSQSVMSGTWCV